MAVDQMYSDALRELEQVKAERDALAAHVERLREVERDEPCYGQIIMDILDYSSGTSLARLKAQWQAEGAYKAAAAIRYDYEGRIHADDIADFVDGLASTLRHQAEGGEP